MTPIIGFTSIRKLINDDVSDIKQYIKQSKGLHEGKRPQVKLPVFASLVDEVHSLIQSGVSGSGVIPKEGKSVTTAAELPLSSTSTPPPAAPVEEMPAEPASPSFNAPQLFKEYDIRGLSLIHI